MWNGNFGKDKIKWEGTLCADKLCGDGSLLTDISYSETDPFFSAASGAFLKTNDITATLPITFSTSTKTFDFDASTTNERFKTIGVNTGALSSIAGAFKTDSTITQGVRVEADTSTRLGFSSFVTGDAQVRFTFRADGLLGFGDGSSTTDTNLYRSAANSLKTDDAFTATQFTSSVATGTSPYAATSTTLNTNLNADMVDGLHSTSLIQTTTDQTAAGIKTFSSGAIIASGAISADFIASGAAHLTNFIFGTDATPPTASNFTIGSVYLQYTP